MALKEAKREKGLRLGKQGRLVIPADVRKELGLSEGDILVPWVNEGRLELETSQNIIRRIQRRFEKIPADVSLVDELLAERREEPQRAEEPMEPSWL